MKILIINGSEVKSPGGVHKTLREVSKDLSKRHDVTVLQGNPEHRDLNEEMYDGFEIIRINSRFDKYLLDFNPEIYLYLRKNLKLMKPDIVHVHGFFTLFSLPLIYLINKMDQKIPIVYSLYFDTSSSTKAGKYLGKVYYYLTRNIIIHYVDHVIAISKFEETEILKSFNLKPDQISTIPLGVDIIDLESNHKIHKDQLNMIFVGYLIKRKNVESILYTLSYLKEELKFDRFQFTIIGNGPEKKNLLKLCKRFKLENYIVWKPFIDRENLLKQIKDSDVFMLLSSSETYGIVVAEALALGTPCIVSNDTALSEFVKENGCFGVKYPIDPSEVAELILSLVGKHVEVGPLSDKIRLWADVSKDYEIEYHKILGK